jgi:hypothetical protein
MARRSLLLRSLNFTINPAGSGAAPARDEKRRITKKKKLNPCEPPNIYSIIYI